MSKSQKRQYNELRIRGVSKKTKDEIDTIAHNLGVDRSQFLKPHLRRIIDETPKKYKQKHID